MGNARNDHAERRMLEGVGPGAYRVTSGWNPAFHIELDWVSMGEGVGEAVHRVVQAFSAAVADQCRSEGRSGLPWPSLDPDAFHDTTRFELGVRARSTSGRQVVKVPIGAPEWDELMGLLETGSIQALTLNVDRPEGDPVGTALARVEFDAFRRTSADVHYVSLSLTRPMARAHFRDLQGWAIDVIRSAAIDLDAVFGLITVDSVAMAHEWAMGYQVEEGLVTAADRVRSYGWCTLLSAHHIKHLGGAARVISEAPVAEVRDVSGDSRERLLLRLSDDIDRHDAPAVVALRDFLEPVLLPRVQPLTEGPALRVATQTSGSA